VGQYPQNPKTPLFAGKVKNRSIKILVFEVLQVHIVRVVRFESHPITVELFGEFFVLKHVPLMFRWPVLLMLLEPLAVEDVSLHASAIVKHTLVCIYDQALLVKSVLVVDQLFKLFLGLPL
jgi:hypothetical protein